MSFPSFLGRAMLGQVPGFSLDEENHLDPTISLTDLRVIGTLGQ